MSPTRKGARSSARSPTLGFDGIRGVRVGKAIRFEIEAPDRAAAEAEVADVCDRFLTNPVIEDADITVTDLHEVPS